MHMYLIFNGDFWIWKLGDKRVSLLSLRLLETFN